MIDQFRTVYRGGTGEIVEKKSRFIATVRLVESEEEALSCLEALRKKYWDARHNCFVYIIGENQETVRCSDDGEPSGTAGRPMLDVVQGAGLRNVLVVVTRYFGGTLLGTGGLVRAYSQAVQEGLANSVLIDEICGGGELMCEDLDYVDFEKIRKAPAKWYLGYSDNTHFTYLLPTICDTAAVYGPCASDFGMEPWHKSVADAFGVLTGEVRTVRGYEGWERDDAKGRSEENPYLPYQITEPRVLRRFPDADRAFEGRLIGGCLDCLVNILGTKYDGTVDFVEKYKEDGFVWFLEACDLNVFAIRRAIWQMEHAGWFQYVKGFLIGRPLQFGQKFGELDQYRAVTDLLGKYNVPIVMDLDIGHLHPAMPLIVGSYAKVAVEGNEIEIKLECR